MDASSIIDDIDDEMGLIQPSLASLAKAGQHILLPWKGRPQRLGSGFSSSVKGNDEDPWRPSPFALPPSHELRYVGETNGGVSSFSDTMSANSSQSSEHTSGSLGITVGNAFISGNATAQYDKSVRDMTNEPALSPDAKRLLIGNSKATNARGAELFSARYGDYYVAGFELGADAGACLAAKASSHSTTETVKLSVTVKVLFVKKTVETSKTTGEYTASADLTFVGYDTLRDENPVSHVASGQPCQPVRQAADDFAARVGALYSAVTEALNSVGLDATRALTGAAYEQLVQSGLVVQLILVPYRSMAEYVTLTSSRLVQLTV